MRAGSLKLEGVAFSIEYPLVEVDVVGIVKGQIPTGLQLSSEHPPPLNSQVLENLGEEEALGVVHQARVWVAHIIQRCVCATSREILQDALDECSSIVQVLGIASDAPRVEVALHDLGAEVVVRSARIPAVLVVELHIFSGRTAIASKVAVAGNETKRLWTNARPDGG